MNRTRLETVNESRGSMTEAGGQLENLEEGESPPLETVTRRM